MTGINKGTYANHVILGILLLVTLGKVSPALAQVHLDGATSLSCLTTELDEGHLQGVQNRGIAFANEARAIVVFVRFMDDNWGDCERWWCEMLEWPQCEDHYADECAVVPKTTLPPWAMSVVHPDPDDFPTTSVPLPANSPIVDSTLTAFFWEQSRTGNGGPRRRAPRGAGCWRRAPRASVPGSAGCARRTGGG